MRSVSGESGAVLPWQVIRHDGNGNRYRVGSYASRPEAQQVADRLGKNGDSGPGSYLVEPTEPGSGGRR